MDASERAGLSKKDEAILKRLRADLAKSNDLVIVDKPVETREFEKATNSDFNFTFENELIKTGAYVKRMSRKADDGCSKHSNTPIMGARSRVINFDEDRVNTFTFKDMCKRNREGVRHSSVLGRMRTQMNKTHTGGFQLPKMNREKVNMTAMK